MTAQSTDFDAAALARTHYENFPVGSFLIPKAKRVHVHRLYAFARVADDIADEMRDADALAAWRRATEIALGRAPDEGVLVPPLLREVAESVESCKLDASLLFRLLDAFARDLEQDRYRDYADLRSYCRDSADPVGRLMLQIFERESDENNAMSDHICTALQLLNHAQDVQKDWRERARIYLPQSAMDEHGVRDEDFESAGTSPALRRCIAELAERAREGLREGWPLSRRIGGRFGLELASIASAASLVLQRLDACDYDVFQKRPKIHKLDAPRVLMRALRRRPPKVLGPKNDAVGV